MNYGIEVVCPTCSCSVQVAVESQEYKDKTVLLGGKCPKCNEALQAEMNKLDWIFATWEVHDV